MPVSTTAWSEFKQDILKRMRRATKEYVKHSHSVAKDFVDEFYSQGQGNSYRLKYGDGVYGTGTLRDSHGYDYSDGGYTADGSFYLNATSYDTGGKTARGRKPGWVTTQAEYGRYGIKGKPKFWRETLRDVKDDVDVRFTKEGFIPM